MANRTVSYAATVHGTNPQYLIESITRKRIYESKYWKEHCTLLNSARVLEKAVDDLRYIGGVYGGNIKPTPFLCLVLKLLQIQPQKDIIYLYIEQPDFKYLRALGAFYLRLVGSSVEVFTKLEPLLSDYRKLRIIDKMHKFSLLHMDEYIDNLLREERVFDVILPRLTKRLVLEENRDIDPYKSALEDHNLLPTGMIEEKVQEEKLKRKNEAAERSFDSRRADRERGDRYHRDDRRHSNYDRSDRNHYRPRSPKDEKPSSHYSAGNGKFRQEEINNENAIRAKLGLKPLH